MTDILAEIAASREAFDQAFARRRLRLQIRRQMWRIGVYNLAVRSRYERRFKRPIKRKVQPVEKNEDDWRSQYWRFDEADRPLSTIENALIALRESPMLAGVIALELVANKIMLKAPLPLDHFDIFHFDMRPLRDDDLTGLVEYLQHLGLASLSRDDCLAAVRRIARENAWRCDDGG